MNQKNGLRDTGFVKEIEELSQQFLPNSGKNANVIAVG